MGPGLQRGCGDSYQSGFCCEQDNYTPHVTSSPRPSAEAEEEEEEEETGLVSPAHTCMSR